MMLVGQFDCGPDLQTSAQSTVQERPKLKDFGSSLRRLKWDPNKKAAVEIKAPRVRGREDEDDVVRVETNLVVCDVQVRDSRGNIVTGLTQSDFIVTEDGRPQDIQHFSLGNGEIVGRTIVLLIDYSGSQLPYIRNSTKAAKMLVDQLRPKDLMAIVTDDVELLVDFTRDKAKLKSALDKLLSKSEGHRTGRSLQFSALMATVREMFSNEDIQPILIFQTDGDEVFGLQPSHPPILSIPDFTRPGRLGAAGSGSPPLGSEFPSTPVPRPTPSAQDPGTRSLSPPTVSPPRVNYARERRAFSLRDLYLAIEKSRVSIYTIIPGPQLVKNRTQRNLEVPPEATAPSVYATLFWGNVAAAGAAIGGWTAYFEKPEDASDLYAKILADINSRYLIGYYPSNKLNDGKRRRVLIEVRGHPDYLLSGRKSYIAPEADN